MSKRVKRDPSFQAKLMVEGFGAETALRHAEAMYQKLTTPAHRDYWGQVLRAVRPYLPPAPQPVYPSMDKMERNVQEWAASIGAIWRIDKDNETVILPLKQRLFGYVQQ